MTKAIYILGGMGPQASGELYKLLIDKAQNNYGAINNNDFPEIIIHSIPVPDFISNKLAKNNALEMLKKITMDLSPQKHKSFAIACNTAHLLAPDLQQTTDTPFISMINETARYIHSCNSTKVGILASPVTINSGLYQTSLKKYNIKLITPDESELRQIELAIRAVISGSKLTKHKEELLKIGSKLIDLGAQQIILGCTELPVIIKATAENRFVSSTDCLANALLNDYYGKK